MRYQLLALDIDGTILDPYGNLTGSVSRAVGAARDRGLQIVLCTGRRYRSALPIAQQLGLQGPMVINNGVLVKDIETGATQSARYLTPDLRPQVLELVREVGTPLLYVDSDDEIDVYTETNQATHPFQLEYLADASAHVASVDSLECLERDDVVMISTMGEERALETLHARSQKLLGDRVTNHQIQNKNYQGVILEFLSPGTSKWAGLSEVASALGIARREIIAVGDDTNDIEMIRNAGLGIAMGNAVRSVQSAADWVVKSNAEGGCVEAIERAVLKLT
ncbi:Cof-type HAD-IIB family hydrolase [Myxococcota bacterium]|nr:Cof-type HAD-IIB family hydrolase [Myxococcota bacterium]